MPVHSHDTTLSFGSAITLVNSVSAPEIEVSDVNITHLASSNGFKEWASGLGDGGEVEFEIQYGKAQVATLYGYIRTTQAFTLTFPDGSTWTGNGHIKKLGGGKVEEDDIIKNSVTIKVTGKPTFTQGA